MLEQQGWYHHNSLLYYVSHRQYFLSIEGWYTAISRKVIGKTVHATIPKGNMGYDQYSVPDTVAVEHTFVAFLKHSQTYVHGLFCHSFKFL